MAGLIDIHAHLIPWMDDGCASMEDSVECGRQFAAAGYTHLCCTPHIWPQFPKNVVSNIRHRTTQLQHAYKDAGISLTLIPGGEINVGTTWPAIKELPRDEIVSYALAGKYLLFDFWAEEFPDYLLPAIEHLQSLNFTLIMAHPERLKLFQREPEQLVPLEKMGVLLQCNSWCLMDEPGTPNRDVSERLLRDRRYFLLGTDTHNAKSIPVRLRGIERAVELAGGDYVHELTVLNPRKIIGTE